MLLGCIHAIKQALHNGWTDNRQKRSTELSKALPLVLIYQTAKSLKTCGIWTFWQLSLPTLVCRFRIGVFGFMINTRKLAATKTDGYWLIKIVLVCIPLLKPHLIFKKLASKRQIEILNVTISLNMFFLKYDCSQINAQISVSLLQIDRTLLHILDESVSLLKFLWIHFWPGEF